MRSGRRPLTSRLHQLMRLAYGFRSKCAICILYIYLIFKRRITGNPHFRRDHYVIIKINEFIFPLFVRELIDFDLILGILINEEYRLPELQPDTVKTIFDLGSNIGITTLYFLTKYPKAKIIAFEPIPENIVRFMKNTRAFEDRVILYPKAIYDVDNKTIEMHINPKLHWSSSIVSRGENTEAISIKTITLDTAMRENHVSTIDILKFDIEGAEYPVLKNSKALVKVRFAVGEFHPDLAENPQDNILSAFSGHRLLFKQDIGGSRFIAAFARK